MDSRKWQHGKGSDNNLNLTKAAREDNEGSSEFSDATGPTYESK